MTHLARLKRQMERNRHVPIRGFRDPTAPWPAGGSVGPCGASYRLDYGVQSYESFCHLAHGHTGMHSDGDSCWTNVREVA